MVDRGSVALGSIPDDAPATTRDVLDERWGPEPRVQLEPRNAATRSEARWRGLAAEVVQITAITSFKCGFSASGHLLVAVDRGTMVHAESRIEGVVVSTRRELGRTLSFVPKGYVLRGTFVPRILPRCGNLYIDPAMSLADPELQFNDIEFEPRLFFDEPALWMTASKMLRPVVERGSQTLLDVRQKDFSVHGSFDHQGRRHFVAAQASHEGQGLPGSKRDAPDQPLAARAAAIAAGHGSVHPGFIDEDKAG